ncbi:hypothetical protein [Enterococcus faecalis]|uniref:hypothetical protein n=1 Tax=Enterococcus faecalis TaxID=1351 RepID=UPI003D12C2CF
MSKKIKLFCALMTLSAATIGALAVGTPVSLAAEQAVEKPSNVTQTTKNLSLGTSWIDGFTIFNGYSTGKMVHTKYVFTDAKNFFENKKIKSMHLSHQFLGKIDFDQTFNAPQYDSNGSLEINLKDYTNGTGLSAWFGDHTEVSFNMESGDTINITTWDYKWFG